MDNSTQPGSSSGQSQVLTPIAPASPAGQFGSPRSHAQMRGELRELVEPALEAAKAHLTSAAGKVAGVIARAAPPTWRGIKSAGAATVGFLKSLHTARSTADGPAPAPAAAARADILTPATSSGIGAATLQPSLDSTGIPPLCAATQSPRRLRNYVVLGGGLFVMIAMLLALLLKESNGEFPARIGSKLNSPATPKAGSGQPSPGGSQSFGQFDDMNAKQIAEYINDNEEWRPRLSATQFDVFWRTIYSGVMREDYIVARECIRGPAFREWMARTRLPAEMREALLALRARLNGARPAGEPDTDYAAMRILEIVQHVSDELMPGENGNCQTVWREHVKKSLLRQEYALARANVDCLLRDFAPTTECRRAMLALRKKLSPSNRSAQ